MIYVGEHSLPTQAVESETPELVLIVNRFEGRMASDTRQLRCLGDVVDVSPECDDELARILEGLLDTRGE